jgi:hypothetical protein
LIASDCFKSKKRRQYFIRVHDKTLSVVAVRVSNPDRCPSNQCNPTMTPCATRKKKVSTFFRDPS